MKKIIILLLFVFNIVLMSSCSSNSNIRLFINEYETYEKMVDDSRKLDLEFDEDDLYYTKIDFSNISFKSIRYFIGGTDYCINKGKVKSYSEHDQNHCETLHNRESFVIYSFEDGGSFAIIYKRRFEDNAYLEWKKETISNVYAYESKYVNYGNETYNLKNSNGEILISVRFKNTSLEMETRVLDYIEKKVMHGYANH